MKRLAPVVTILLAIFMFMGGTGGLPAVIGIRLNEANYSAPVIGALGTSYFAGLTVGSILAFRLISGVGHIRAFAALVSILSASVLSYALAQNVLSWALLRFANGFCVAGVFVCLESWLSDRAEENSRGATLAFYMMALYGGQALSQLLLGLEAGNPKLPFLVAAIILSLTVVPVALTQMTAPPHHEQKSFSLKALYAASPLGLAGTVATGLMLGAFYIMAPVHAQRIGLSNLEIASLIGAVIAGGVILQWPIGWLSDRYDRRSVIIVCFALAALTCFAMAVARSFAMCMTFGIMLGGFAFALYPLCVAHTNDHVLLHERVGASGGLILAYSIGATIGPFAGALLMKLFGPGGLYGFLSAVAAFAFLFGIWRQFVSAPVPDDEQHIFHIMPRTSPVAASLDPEVPSQPDGQKST